MRRQLFQWRKAYLQGSLVAVGANETVVAASELQEAERRINQLEGALGRTTLEIEILKEAEDVAEANGEDCAIVRIAGRREVKAVCQALKFSRSHFVAKKKPRDLSGKEGRSQI